MGMLSAVTKDDLHSQQDLIVITLCPFKKPTFGEYLHSSSFIKLSLSVRRVVRSKGKYCISVLLNFSPARKRNSALRSRSLGIVSQEPHSLLQTVSNSFGAGRINTQQVVENSSSLFFCTVRVLFKGS